jgi:helix-turn-helix protein
VKREDPAQGRATADGLNVGDKRTRGRRHGASSQTSPERRQASVRIRWLAAVRDSELTDRELLVALVLGTWMDMDGTCWPSLEAIAAGARRHVATIARALNVLETLGWLDRDRGGGRSRSTTYRAMIPSHLGARVSASNSRSPSTHKLSQPKHNELSRPGARRSTEVPKEDPVPIAVSDLAPPTPVTDYIEKHGLRRARTRAAS